MTATVAPLTRRPAWQALEAHHRQVRDLHLRQLFADDPQRGTRLAVEAAGIYLDYSKNRVTDETLRLLVRLAEESGLRARIDAMFRGDKINVTENRAVLHVALRAPKGERIVVDVGHDILAVHGDDGVAGRAQSDMKHGPLLGDVDLLALEHRVDALAQAGLVGELQQEAQRLVGDTVLRVIEVKAGSKGGQPFAALGIIGK